MANETLTQPPTPELVGVGSKELLALRDRLMARAENAYCDMISLARKDESLGWEIKVERGEFGRKELDAHCAGGEKLGRHRALVEACREIDTLLKEANADLSHGAAGGSQQHNAPTPAPLAARND